MKKAQFFIDDVIWLMRDLTRQKPKSLFDNGFLAVLKKAHEEYSLKVQLNLFYSTSPFYGDDSFTLAEMTDEYKSEWEQNSDWLKLAFHAYAEFPIFPYVNSPYDEVSSHYKLITREIKRFAGEKSLAVGVVPHFAPTSREGIMALKDCGVKITYATYGEKRPAAEDLSDVPKAFRERISQNRQPETMLFTRRYENKVVDNTICGYNHITDKQYEAIFDNTKTVLDEKTGMRFKNSAQLVLNSTKLIDLEAELKKITSREFIIIGNHEQYFYSDYSYYQPDYAEKILTMAKLLKAEGYSYIFMEELASE
jgi:hypothetical protein